MTRRPLDQRGAEELFECHELAASGGQGKTQLSACGGQVPSIRNLNEHSRRPKLVHGRIIAKNGRMYCQIFQMLTEAGRLNTCRRVTEERVMKIGVFGAGAIGGYMAGELALGGP
jgi:hypothetical protein